jgi:AAA+ ATPase superfamily predicted ATPase
MSFVAREEELKILDTQYLKLSSTFVAVYGRRRIGKTELVNNFFASAF